jgi:hypothetical protein
LPSFPTAYKPTYVNLVEHGSFEIMAIAFRWRLALSIVKSGEDLYVLLYSQDSWGNKINITLKYFEDFFTTKTNYKLLAFSWVIISMFLKPSPQWKWLFYVL